MFYLSKSRRLEGRFEYEGALALCSNVLQRERSGYSFCSNVQKCENYSFARISFNMFFHMYALYPPRSYYKNKNLSLHSFFKMVFSSTFFQIRSIKNKVFGDIICIFRMWL